MSSSGVRRWVTWAATAAVAAGLVMSTNTAAYGDEAQAVQVCNSEDPEDTDYTRVNHEALPDGLGTLYLLWDQESGQNCAITVGSVSSRTYMDVGLRHEGGSNAVWDHGDFTQYAGPVYLEARQICVDWTGAVGERSVTVTGTNCRG